MLDFYNSIGHWGAFKKPPSGKIPTFFEASLFLLFKMSQNLNPVGGLTKLTDVIAAAYAEIVGTKDKVFNSGSHLQLVCVLTLATARPDYIFW